MCEGINTRALTEVRQDRSQSSAGVLEAGGSLPATLLTTCGGLGPAGVTVYLSMKGE